MRQASSAVAALFALVLPTAVHGQPTPAPRPIAPSPLALVVTYADGRVGHELLGEKPSKSWTPQFPLIATLFVPEPLDVIEIDSVLWEDGTTVVARQSMRVTRGLVLRDLESRSAIAQSC